MSKYRVTWEDEMDTPKNPFQAAQWAAHSIKTQSTAFTVEELSDGTKHTIILEANNSVTVEEAMKAIKSLAGLDPWIGDPKMKDHFQDTIYPLIERWIAK